LGLPIGERSIETLQIADPAAREVFDEWIEKADKTIY
jgi:hypothetical protein